MTIQELRKAIKRQTEVINERLIEYYEADGTDKLVNKEIEYLKTVTGTSSRKVYLSMNTHRKNKAELELAFEVITDEDLNIIESDNLYLNPKSKYDWYAAKNILAFSKNFYNSQKDFRYHYNEIKRVFESVDFVFGYACLNDLTYLKKEFKRYNCKDIDFKT